MSTFLGQIEELPRVSIDRFTNLNWNSTVFFLSHCHADHMKGLDSTGFQKMLTERNHFLYSSHVSVEILKRMYPAISSHLRELDLYGPTIIESPNQDYAFNVTPIPAGHCPGSVMFLFEIANKTILYTGDYRINPADLSKLKAFYTRFGQLRTIDKIWLDTTFFLKSYETFPSRYDSVKEICTIIREWMGKSPRHIIRLQTSAKYGYEYLFMEISKEFKMPIHVNEEVYDFYKYVPEMDECVTQFGDETQLHCACGSRYTVICRDVIAYQVKTIKISAWRWQRIDLEKGISEKESGIHYVCYSTHASYNEGAALLKFLKPKEVEISVLHSDEMSNFEIRRNIKEILQEIHSPIKASIKEQPRLFKIGKRNENTTVEKDWTTGNPSILDSPPRKKKL